MDIKPWKTKEWFTSPWNFADEVMRGMSLPETIKIHDVTLRDGEQQAGVVFNKHEKVKIAEKLAEAGVHRIEAGMPAVSAEDAEAIREIVKRNFGPQIFCFARCMVEDVQRAVDCGVSGIIMEVPSSEHLIRHAYQWPLEKAVETAIEATLYAKQNNLYTVFFPIDASRAELDWFLNLIERIASEGHMDALAVVDTFGGCSPNAITYLVRKIRERIDKPLEAHFHNDFGLATANTLLALSAGVEVAHTTVLSLGERAGNASFEEVVLALKTMYNKDVGIDTTRLMELSRTVQDLAKVHVKPNQSIIGETIFKIESGIVASWFKNCVRTEPLELVPFLPSLVGQSDLEVVLGKKSGIDSVKLMLEPLGIELSEERIRELVNSVKERSLKKKGLLTREEFYELVSAAERNVG